MADDSGIEIDAPRRPARHPLGPLDRGGRLDPAGAARARRRRAPLGRGRYVRRGRRRSGPTVARSSCAARSRAASPTRPRRRRVRLRPDLRARRGRRPHLRRDDPRREARHQPPRPGVPIAVAPRLTELRTARRVGVGSPAAEVDLPHVDDLVAVDDVQALVLGDGRVDVGGEHPHPVADRRTCRRHAERDVLVGAEPARRPRRCVGSPWSMPSAFSPASATRVTAPG